MDLLIQEVLGGVKDSAAVYLPIIEKRYPNNPNMLFLKGLMETDGEKAMDIFVKLYNNHPTSEYGDDAVMKIAEFYYASGLYIQSADWLKKMPIYYSRSKHIERAIKLFLNSLIVSGHKDTAIFYSKVFKKQFPSMDVGGKIDDLLKEYENSNKTSNKIIETVSDNNQEVFNASTFSKAIETKANESSGRYSLQSGAFILHKNAADQKIHLLSAGYDARITELYRQNRVLYAVRIGYYRDKKEAQEISRVIKSKMVLNTIIVINE